MPQKSDLIDFFSRQWEDKCRDALRKVSEIDDNDIPAAEKWWRIKQLLAEMTRPERRKKPRPQKPDADPVLESTKARERRKLDLHSQEWIEKCAEASRKCAEMEDENISEKERLWRTRQLIKELALVDKKRDKISR